MPLARWLNAIDDAILRLTDQEEVDAVAVSHSSNHVGCSNLSTTPPRRPPTNTWTGEGTRSNMQRLPDRVQIGRPLSHMGRSPSNASDDTTGMQENSIKKKGIKTVDPCTAIPPSNFGRTKINDVEDDASQAFDHLGSFSHGKEKGRQSEEAFLFNPEANAGNRILSISGKEAKAKPLLLPPPPLFLSDVQQAQYNKNTEPSFSSTSSLPLPSTLPPFISQRSETSLLPPQQHLNVDSTSAFNPPHMPPLPPPLSAPLNKVEARHLSATIDRDPALYNYSSTETRPGPLFAEETPRKTRSPRQPLSKTPTMSGMPAYTDRVVVRSLNPSDTHHEDKSTGGHTSKGLPVTGGLLPTLRVVQLQTASQGDKDLSYPLFSSAMQGTTTAAVLPTLLSSDPVLPVPINPAAPESNSNINTIPLTIPSTKQQGKASNTEPMRTSPNPAAKQRAAPPSPVPGKTFAVPRMPRTQRSTLLRNSPGMTPRTTLASRASSLRTLVAPSPSAAVTHLASNQPALSTSISNNPNGRNDDAFAAACVSERTVDLARPPPEQQPGQSLLQSESEPRKDNIIVSSSASVGSILLENENEYFYNSEAEVDDNTFDDDSSFSMSQALLDMERDASIAIVRNPEFDHWATTSGLRHLEEQDANINSHGVIHVRFVKAYNLPCSENTTIQPVLSLPPWKGCIRAERAVASKSKVRGVHVTWNLTKQLQIQAAKKPEEKGEEEEDEMSELSDAVLDTSRDDDVPRHSTETLSTIEGSGDNYKYTKDRSQYYSMVHDYNSEDTPIPSICLELMSISLFENLLSSVKISCLVLMEQPGIVFRKWFVMTKPNVTNVTKGTIIEEGADEASKEDVGEGQDGASSEVEPVTQFRRVSDPLVLLDIWFEPSGGKKEKSESPSNKATASDDVGIVSSNILGKVDAHRPKSHLFRIRSYWTPAFCALCSAVLTIRKGYRCEEKTCGLDSCANCLLSIDVRLPCGSDETRCMVKDCIQSKLSFGHVMQIVAPVSEGGYTAEPEKHSIPAVRYNATYHDSLQPQVANEPPIQSERVILSKTTSGIGTLRLHIEKAVLFKYAFPPEAYLEDILTSSNVQTKDGGDHFVRVSWDNGRESVRTRTVHQTAKPNFGEEGFLDFTVPHYGAEFKIEIIDANTDMPVGSYLLSAQQVLQSQHDFFATSKALELKQLTDARAAPADFRRMTAELRSGVKSGFGLDFYSSLSNKSYAEEAEHDSSRSGAIRGYLDISVYLEEDLDLMYTSAPRKAEGRPSPDLNVELIQLHIGRIIELVEGVKGVVSTIVYCLSWKNPLLTILCLTIFVYSCIKCNAEYVGSIPSSFIILYMSNKARIRRFGMFKRYWVENERDARLEAEKTLKTSVSVHRSIAIVKVMVSQGRNIRSKDLGLPGRYKASVTWRPDQSVSANEKEKCKQIGGTAPLFLGTTTTSSLTVNPVWQSIKENSEILKLKSLLYDTQAQIYDGPHSQFQPHNFEDQRSLADDSDNSISSDPFDENVFFTAPILQPVKVGRVFDGLGQENERPHLRLRQLPWEKCSGSVIVQVVSDNVLSKLLIFEDIVGEVEVPFTHLMNGLEIGAGEYELKGWFSLTTKEQGTAKHTFEIDGSSFSLDDEDHEEPEVYLCLRLILPQARTTTASDLEKELSAAVADEMIRAASLAKNNAASVIGNGLNTINTVGGLLGNIQMIQNQMGSILDMIESFLNIFTWAQPHRSFVVFGAVLILWLSLSIVPTRVLVLVGGLVPFITNFLMIFGSRNNASEISDKASALVTEGAEKGSVANLFLNYIEALPTNEDLRRMYYWESRRLGEKERQFLAKSKRAGRLKKLWRAVWYGNVMTRRSIDEGNGRLQWSWDSIFMVIQGHRIVWWCSEKHFDETETPDSYVLLAGHAGLASLSPIDMRDYGQDERKRIVIIFGRGPNGQHKVSLLAHNIEEKAKIEEAAIQALTEDKRD